MEIVKLWILDCDGDLNEVLSHVLIDFDCNDIELSCSQWRICFSHAVINNYYVVPSICWSRHKIKCWFSQSTIGLIHKKKNLWYGYKHSGNPGDINLLVTYIVRMATRQDTVHHSNMVSKQCYSNPKQFWRMLLVKLVALIPLLFSLLSIFLYPCVICLNSLPFGWVSGNIVPIHKQNDKHITSYLAIVDQLASLLLSLNFIPPFSFSFREPSPPHDHSFTIWF